jgi:hypothetical protein
VTGFHVSLVSVTAGFGALLLLARRMQPEGPRVRRAGEVLVAALVPVAAALMLLPGLGAGVCHQLGALTASSPWYADIEEFGPLLLGLGPLRVELNRMLRELGLTLWACPSASWRSSEPGENGLGIAPPSPSWHGGSPCGMGYTRHRRTGEVAVDVSTGVPSWRGPFLVMGVLVVALLVPSLAPGWFRPSDVSPRPAILKWLAVPSPRVGVRDLFHQLGHSISTSRESR